MEIRIYDTQINQQGATINDSVWNWQVALSVDQESGQNRGLLHIYLTHQA